MRYTLAVLVLALVTSSPASAQSSTADGIGALARGDTATALRILRPLAEASDPDPLAQFFLASLYASGSGVPMSTIRACGLYLKSAVSTNPLANQAITLADAIRQDHATLRALCSAAQAGVWHEPPSMRFQLGRDHWVTTDTSGFTVGYHGTQARVPTDWGGPEWAFLPPRYTRLEMTRPVATTRHFIEFLFWVPNDVEKPSLWSLVWSVYEVVDSQARALGDGVGVAAVGASRPPASYPAETICRLQVNTDGEVERVVTDPGGSIRVVPYQRLP